MSISTQKAKEISIEKYLQHHGHSPVRVSGGELYYRSPLREQEQKPSFAVNPERNIWNDLGMGQGGSIIDLVMQMYHYDIRQALEHLADYVGDSTFTHTSTGVSGNNLFAPKYSTIEIESTRQLTNFVLLKYLREERQISEPISKKYLREVWYRNKGKSKFFAFGWQNDSGGYEIRSSLFKGICGEKDITTLKTDDKSKLYLFEGMTDFLTALTMKRVIAFEGTTIILNGASLAKRLLPIVTEREWEQIFVFFDNDTAGERALSQLTNEVSESILRPQNDLYKDFKDLNEYWVDQRSKA